MFSAALASRPGTMLGRRVVWSSLSGFFQCRETAGGVAEGIVGLRRGDEAERLSLVEAAIRQGLADLHGVIVDFVGAIALREGGGELGGHAVESDDAGDFFDEIDAAEEVEAVAGDGPGGAVLGQTELW
jgi:hypothetical protein